MATLREKTDGKSVFLKKYLVETPDAGKEAVEAAWRAAGHEGTISQSLIGKVRKDLGLTKGAAPAKGRARLGAGSEVRGRRPPAKGNGESMREGLEGSAAPQVEGGERTSVLIRLEGSIDELLHEIKTAGGLPEFEGMLRRARRILVRSHVE
ncbi:MAG TPA: hypothetical protein VKP69_06440 [Isosphaeraceae bacterium]|nr:hypothetical protein [Isosphaeraceae bacterium]